MYTFLIGIAVLIGGYIIYSKIPEKIFGVDPNRKTPAYELNDGVDYVPMSWGKVFLIQFLNIAGLGPIFGAILGAMFGPVAFLWIILGCVFAGAVHDYFAGMLSVRLGGLSIPEIVGKYLGLTAKQFMRGFTIILMILVGAVFMMGPAKIIDGMTSGFLSTNTWIWIIFAYYLIATLLPIDKIIGNIYPLFGGALLFMALGIAGMILFGDFHIPELTFESMRNMKSAEYPIFPILFITIACGAISGFHSTQAPLMARCLKNEKEGRRVFYGAMIAEGIVAMIWAAAAMAFFGGVGDLNSTMAEQGNNAAWAVNEISNTLLGKIGGILAIFGVVAAPITSGDTAFRSARLITADFLKLKQEKIINRLYISIPLFIIGYLLTQINFGIIWRYFAWANQTLATIVLWAITVYLLSEKKFYWITLIPSVFMTAVVTTYILIAPEGFSLEKSIAYLSGAGIAVVCLVVFLYTSMKQEQALSR